ncbi:MAG: hypothetical protein LC797_02280, partial [Chloroflexi bacterium]|nr:hypothetical protein [Chloroflexota bacterium]
RLYTHGFADLFGEAYAAELVHFVARVRGPTHVGTLGEAPSESGRQPDPAANGEDGRAALAIALAAIRSVATGRPVQIAEITAER